MKLTIANIANIAAIISIPLMFLFWLFTRERLAEFWKKRGKFLIVIIVVIIGIITSWRIGWLSCLQYQVTWPIWGVVLFSIVFICIILGIVLLVLYITSSQNPTESTSKYYTLYGARWYLDGNIFCNQPICAKCLMEMRHVAWPDMLNPLEIWKCRQCGHEIRWDSRQNGDLLEDVRAHYNAKLRSTNG